MPLQKGPRELLVPSDLGGHSARHHPGTGSSFSPDLESALIWDLQPPELCGVEACIVLQEPKQKGPSFLGPLRDCHRQVLALGSSAPGGGEAAGLLQARRRQREGRVRLRLGARVGHPRRGPYGVYSSGKHQGDRRILQNSCTRQCSWARQTSALNPGG